MSNPTQPRMTHASVVNGHHHLNFRKFELKAPLEDEVGVKIIACGICHTDLACMTEGAVLGHEGAGIVEQIGSAYPEGIDGHFFGQSAFADYCLVTEQNLVKVDAELPLNLLAPGTLVRLTGSGGQPLTRGRRAISVIQGDSVAQEFIPKLIDYWQQGKFPIEQLVTYYHFDDINRAIKDAHNGNVIKAVLIWE